MEYQTGGRDLRRREQAALGAATVCRGLGTPVGARLPRPYTAVDFSQFPCVFQRVTEGVVIEVGVDLAVFA